MVEDFEKQKETFFDWIRKAYPLTIYYLEDEDSPWELGENDRSNHQVTWVSKDKKYTLWFGYWAGSRAFVSLSQQHPRHNLLQGGFNVEDDEVGDDVPGILDTEVIDGNPPSRLDSMTDHNVVAMLRRLASDINPLSEEEKAKIRAEHEEIDRR